MPVYLPTMAMVTSPSGLRMRSLIRCQVGEVGLRRGLDAEGGQHLAVETAGVIGLGHGVDIVDVARLDHGAFAHVAEQRELAPLALRNRPVGAAQQNVGLDADGAQFARPSAGSAWSSIPPRSG